MSNQKVLNCSTTFVALRFEVVVVGLSCCSVIQAILTPAAIYSFIHITRSCSARLCCSSKDTPHDYCVPHKPKPTRQPWETTW